MTLIIKTPPGEGRGLAVTQGTKTGSSGALVLPGARGVRSKVSGKAVVVEIVPRSLLSAMLIGTGVGRDATHWVYPADKWHEAMSGGGEMMTL